MVKLVSTPPHYVPPIKLFHRFPSFKCVFSLLSHYDGSNAYRRHHQLQWIHTTPPSWPYDSHDTKGTKDGGRWRESHFLYVHQMKTSKHYLGSLVLNTQTRQTHTHTHILTNTHIAHCKNMCTYTHFQTLNILLWLTVTLHVYKQMSGPGRTGLRRGEAHLHRSASSVNSETGQWPHTHTHTSMQIHAHTCRHTHLFL